MFSEACVSHSVHNRLHGYWFTAHPCYGAVGMHPTGMLSCFKVILSSRLHNDEFFKYVLCMYLETDIYKYERQCRHILYIYF